jgi:hypothetical protein
VGNGTELNLFAKNEMLKFIRVNSCRLYSVPVASFMNRPIRLAVAMSAQFRRAAPLPDEEIFDHVVKDKVLHQGDALVLD